jgi:hypothetical protein
MAFKAEGSHDQGLGFAAETLRKMQERLRRSRSKHAQK